MKRLTTYLKSIWANLFPKASPPTGKILVEFSDGVWIVVDNAREAQSAVLQRCMTSMEPMYANFYSATEEDIAEFEKHLSTKEPA